MARDAIQVELLPHERAALLKWNFTPEVRDQPEACGSDGEVATTISPSLPRWLASDLTHTIVKRGCRDDDTIDLRDRLDTARERASQPWLTDALG